MKRVASGRVGEWASRRVCEWRVPNRKSKIENPQSGAGLVELVVAIAILIMALVVFISALSTGAFAARNANQLTTANNLAATQLETIKAATYVTGTASYPAIASGAYSISQRISYWNGVAFTAVPATDSGMQWITVTISYNGQTLTQVENYKVNR